MVRSTAFLICAIGWLSHVHADGMMVRRTVLGTAGQLVQSPRQEALLIVRDQQVRVILRTHFEKGPTELAWVVPVPAKPTDVKPADDAIFSKLEAATAPKIVLMEYHAGCACSASGGKEEAVAAVTVHETGQAGMFDYAVLSAGKADELQRWLAANEYQLPPNSEPALKPYIRAGWFWLAMKVRAAVGLADRSAASDLVFLYE